jgi:hypothetical protein
MLAYFYRHLNMRVFTTLYTDADNLITLLRNPHPRPGEWSLIPLLKVLQTKLAGRGETLSDKEMRSLVVPILAAEGLLTHCDYATGSKVQLKFIPGAENPADILTKPRDVLLLSKLVTLLGTGGASRLESDGSGEERGSQAGPGRQGEGGANPYSMGEGVIQGSIVRRVPALGEAPTGSIEVENPGVDVEGEVDLDSSGDEVVGEVEAEGVPVGLGNERNGLERIMERSQPVDGIGGTGGHRATRTGYGLRPSVVVRKPPRLAYIVAKAVGAVLEALEIPGSIPDWEKAP